MNYNTSWWKYNKLVEDYFARVAAVMTQGDVIRDVMVIHPASTVWSVTGCTAADNAGSGLSKSARKANMVSEEFNEFVRHLLGMHYDFDLGDETIMEEKGRVERRKLYVNPTGEYFRRPWRFHSSPGYFHA